MQGYIARRLAGIVPTLLGISVLVFILVRVMPGDVAEFMAGPGANRQQIELIREQLRLNRPLPSQYLSWLGDVLHGHFGTSYQRGVPVIDEIARRFPVTLQLLIMTVGVSLLVGVPLGALAAVKRGGWVDALVRGFSIVGLSIPSFWAATLVILLPAIYFSYAPPFANVSFFENPWDNLREYGPPSLVLGLGSAAALARVVRAALLDVLGADYIRTARSKGLREVVVIRRHALGNAMLPIVTVVGLEVATLLGGAVLIEQVFALPGLGRLMLESLLMRDYPVVQTMALYIALIVMLMTLTVDVLYARLDPRVRYQGRR
jgi:peptide/nickel transport system permease protein